MRKPINILVVGKTGSGKSSLCNYIFGESVFATGAGRPVTGWEDNFSCHTVDYENYSLRVYDSVGIEPDNMDRWKNNLHDFLEKKGPSVTLHPTDWIHAAIYVVNASAARIENAEINLIKEIEKSEIPVQIILTNCDKCTDSELTELKATIRNCFSKLNISEVCSVSIRKRSGVAEPYGKEQAIDALISSLDFKLRKKVIDAFIENTRTAILSIQNDITNKISDSDLGFVNLIKGFIKEGDSFDIDKLLKFDFNETLESSEGLLELSYSLENFTEALGLPVQSSKGTSDIIRELKFHLDTTMHEAGEKMAGEIDRIVSDIEDGSFKKKLRAAIKTIRAIINLKGFFLSTLKSMFDQVLSDIDKIKKRSFWS